MGKTLLLLSGGIDSTVALASMVAQGRRVSALCIQYGQRIGAHEAKAAGLVAAYYRVPLSFARVDFLQGGMLQEAANVVPARNLGLIAVAAAHALHADADAVAIGCNLDDVTGFPDCSHGFVESMAAVLNVYGLALDAPMASLRKAEVIDLGRRLGAPLHKTHSCYTPSLEGKPCGACGACELIGPSLIKAIADGEPL